MVSFLTDKLLPSLFPFSFSSSFPPLSPFQLHHSPFHFQLPPHFQLNHPPHQHHHFFSTTTSSSFSTTSSSTTTSSSFSTILFFLSTTFLFSSQTLPLLVVMALQCSLGFA